MIAETLYIGYNKLYFQMTFSLPSTSCLLKLPIVDRARCKLIGRSVDEVNIERMIYCRVFTLSLNVDLKFGHFTLLFGRLRRVIVVKFKPHV